MAASIATISGDSPSKRTIPCACAGLQPHKKPKIAPCMCSDELARVTAEVIVLRQYKQKYLILKLCVTLSIIIILLFIIISYREGVRTILANEKRAFEAHANLNACHPVSLLDPAPDPVAAVSPTVRVCVVIFYLFVSIVFNE